MPKNIKRFIPIIVVLAIVAVSVYYLDMIADDGTGALNASGTVETTEVIIAPEVGGRVVEVLAAEGDLVQTGDILFTLDDELLQAQRGRAEAAFEAAEASLGVVIASRESAQAAISAAQAQYDLAVYAARFEEMSSRVTAWGEDLPEEFEQPVWYFEKSELLDSAETEAQTAEDALKIEGANFERVIQDASNADVVEAEARLSDAQAAFLVAQDVVTRAQTQGDAQLETHAQDQFDSAEAELDTAQLAYDQMLSDTAASDVLEARARLAVARERYETALDRWNQLLTGEESLQVKAAQTALQQAEANAPQIEAGITQAEKAIAQVQAELDLLDIQMEKLVIRVPVAGVVLSRNIEPGEVIKPGGIAMTLGQLDDLSITVYVPEDRYGEIRLGDEVDVTVDSFPGETFSATVVRIADKAEFTPRNVQTPEGRRTTVFAVELAVSDPAVKLKPGMPADVAFSD